MTRFRTPYESPRLRVHCIAAARFLASSDSEGTRTLSVDSEADVDDSSRARERGVWREW